MTTMSRTTTGLIYRSDGTLTGWTSGGNWTSAAEPTYCCSDPLPLSLLRGEGAEVNGIREPQMFAEGGVLNLIYSGGDGRSGWKTFRATLADGALDWERKGEFGPGLVKVSSGTLPSEDHGYVEKRGSTYILHRVTGGSMETGSNYGLTGTPYGWDIWTAPSLDGPWTGVREIPFDTVGAGPGNGEQCPGCIVLDTGTYYGFASVLKSGGNPNIGILTSATATGAYTPYQLDPIFSDYNLDSYGHENPDVFYSPTFSKWCMLLNSFASGAVGNDRNTLFVSDSLTDWSAARGYFVQKVPGDSANRIGVVRRVTGPDGALVYDAASGIIPIVYDADPDRYGTYDGAANAYHLGRRIRTAALEPSPAALRYAGSADNTFRYLLNTVAHSDIVLECTIQVTAARGAAQLAVDYRSDGGNNLYRVYANIGGSFTLYKTVGGGALTKIADGGGTLTLDVGHVMHRLKISAIGNVHRVWLDGELKINVTDTSSPVTSGIAQYLWPQGFDGDFRCLSYRTSDTVTITGLTPGTSCLVRGHGGMPAGSVVADATGTGTFTHTHYPLASIRVGGVDYAPTGGIWGGDTLTFTGLPSSTASGPLGIGIMG